MSLNRCLSYFSFPDRVKTSFLCAQFEYAWCLLHSWKFKYSWQLRVSIFWSDRESMFHGVFFFSLKLSGQCDPDCSDHDGGTLSWVTHLPSISWPQASTWTLATSLLIYHNVMLYPLYSIFQHWVVCRSPNVHTPHYWQQQETRAALRELNIAEDRSPWHHWIPNPRPESPTPITGLVERARTCSLHLPDENEPPTRSSAHSAQGVELI